MIGRIPDDLQGKAAKVAGLAYLLVLAASVFAEFYVPSRLFVAGDVAQTARNIVANETLYRAGIAANLTGFALDVMLLVALYVVLAPVNRSLALAAAAWRLLETATMVTAALHDFDVLRLLGGAQYLHAIEPERLQAMARLAIGAHAASYNVGLFLFGFGSTLYCWLWWESRYIPRALAALGVFASALTGACALAFIVFPEAAKLASPGCFAPVFVFELAMGVLLLSRGLSRPG